MHELNAICQASNEEVMHMTARQDVMHLIDPVQAFNAYNLSMGWKPEPNENEKFKMSVDDDPIQNQE